MPSIQSLGILHALDQLFTGEAIGPRFADLEKHHVFLFIFVSIVRHQLVGISVTGVTGMHRFDAALDGKVQSGIEGLIKRQSRELVQQESCDGRTPVKSCRRTEALPDSAYRSNLFEIY